MEDLVNEERADEMLFTAKLVQNLGFLSLEAFERFEKEAIAGMCRFGNEFIQALGITLSLAHIQDAVKIIQVWQNEISQHQMHEQIYQAKKRAEKEQENA